MLKSLILGLIVAVISLSIFYVALFLRKHRLNGRKCRGFLSFFRVEICREKFYELTVIVCILLSCFAAYYFNLTITNVDIIFIVIILAMIHFDFRYFILPDHLMYLLMWGGLLFASLDILPISLHESIYGVVFGYLFLAFIALVGILIFKRSSLGRGDIKFFAAINAWIGYQYFFEFLLLSAILGILSTFVFRYIRSEYSRIIPFGVSLGISGIIFLFIEKYQY